MEVEVEQQQTPVVTELKSEKAPEVIIEKVKFKLVYAKTNYEIEFPLDQKVEDLKQHIEQLTGVPKGLQKLMFKGMLKSEDTLRTANIKDGAKLMLVGSKVNDVVEVVTAAPNLSTGKAEASTSSTSTREPLASQKHHKKILEKGLPEDAEPSIKGKKEPLPKHPLSGIYGNGGLKVRVTFRPAVDQLLIMTSTKTDTIPFSSIRDVYSEPIPGHEEYFIVSLQLGATENSRYYLYFVPAQYVDAIKDSVLGQFAYF